MRLLSIQIDYPEPGSEKRFLEPFLLPPAAVLVRLVTQEWQQGALLSHG